MYNIGDQNEWKIITYPSKKKLCTNEKCQIHNPQAVFEHKLLPEARICKDCYDREFKLDKYNPAKYIPIDYRGQCSNRGCGCFNARYMYEDSQSVALCSDCYAELINQCRDTKPTKDESTITHLYHCLAKETQR